MPFPQLAVDLAAEKLGHGGAARTKFRGDEASIRQRHHGVQVDRIRGHRASDPCQGRCLRARVELEDFDRFPPPMVDAVQGMDRVPSRPESEAMETCLLGREIYRSRTRV